MAAAEDQPIVIAHRGASAYRPEHTLAAYELAIGMGADYIEPDLVSTRDGVLVARHENEISGTTDVADRADFADRRTTKAIDGAQVSGWFTEDFTLAELKTLRARERIPALRPANAAFDGLFEIPTLEEVILLAQREGVGIYPETKHSTYFDSIGLALEEPLVTALRRHGWDSRESPVFVQSFEVGNLRELSRRIAVRLVQLTGRRGTRPYDLQAAGDPRSYEDLLTPEGLRQIAGYADGIGPERGSILPRDEANRLGPPTPLLADAHGAGLLVHPWTFRPENSFLAEEHRDGDPASDVYLGAPGDHPAELALFYREGVDGVFADDPAAAVAVRAKMRRGEGSARLPSRLR